MGLADEPAGETQGRALYYRAGATWTIVCGVGVKRLSPLYSPTSTEQHAGRSRAVERRNVHHSLPMDDVGFSGVSRRFAAAEPLRARRIDRPGRRTR